MSKRRQGIPGLLEGKSRGVRRFNRRLLADYRRNAVPGAGTDEASPGAEKAAREPVMSWSSQRECPKCGGNNFKIYREARDKLFQCKARRCGTVFHAPYMSVRY